MFSPAVCIMSAIGVGSMYEWLGRLPVTGYLNGDSRESLQHLIRQGPAIFPIAERMLRDPSCSPTHLSGLLSVISQIQADRSRFVAPVGDLLSHHDRFVRNGAAELIGLIGSARDAPPLVALLWDEDLPGAAPFIALGNIGDERSADALGLWLRTGRNAYKNAVTECAIAARRKILTRVAAEKEAKAAAKP